nr:PAS domain S-box protein [Methylomonas koyamae]
MPENTTPVTGQEWLGAKFPSLVGGRRGGLRHCLFAALLTVLALLVRLGWAPASAELQHLTFFPAVVVAAAVGGYRAGLLATGLGALAATYFFTPPYFAITADNLRLSFWANSVFAFDGIVVSLAIEAMHRYRDRYRSELVQSEAALAALNESQGRFRSLFEQMPDPAWLIRDEHFVEANAAALRALGLSSKPELLHLHPVDISPEFQPDGEASARKAAKQFEIVRRSGIHRFNWTHKRLDGTLLPVEVTLTQIQWDGRPAMYSVWRDMGDSQRAAENLRRAKQLMESVIQNIPAVVFLKRADDLRFELFNRAGEELLGYRAEQVLGKTDATCFRRNRRICLPIATARLWRQPKRWISRSRWWRRRRANCVACTSEKRLCATRPQCHASARHCHRHHRAETSRRRDADRRSHVRDRRGDHDQRSRRQYFAGQ